MKSVTDVMLFYVLSYLDYLISIIYLDIKPYVKYKIGIKGFNNYGEVCIWYLNVKCVVVTYR